MWILVAEAMGALLLFLFIVWWTLGPTQRRERDALRREAEHAAEDAASTAARPARIDASAGSASDPR